MRSQPKLQGIKIGRESVICGICGKPDKISIRDLADLLPGYSLEEFTNGNIKLIKKEVENDG